MTIYIIERQQYGTWHISHAIEAASRKAAEQQLKRWSVNSPERTRLITEAQAKNKDYCAAADAVAKLRRKQAKDAPLPDFSDMPSLADRAAQQYAGWKVQPENNTEAAQLDALLMDTPAGPQYAMPGLEPTAQLRMF